jgi:hypothetical protein
MIFSDTTSGKMVYFRRGAGIFHYMPFPTPGRFLTVYIKSKKLFYNSSGIYLKDIVKISN